MRNILFAAIFLVMSCIPKPYAISQKNNTTKVYFKEIEGRYGQIVDKTQLYVLRNSKGYFVPVEDSMEAQYYVHFEINSSLPRLKNPENKTYEVVVKVRPKDNSSLVGLAEAKDNGKWTDVVSPLSQELARNLVSIFKRLTKPEKEIPPPENEKENE
jgi:hypothetical protein